MVKPGGHLVVGTPTNNLSGHGFYQFSPELLFRALGPPSGFDIERMMMVEYEQVTGTAFGSLPFFAELEGSRYEVELSALDSGRQISFTSRNPTMLFVLARRASDQEPLVRAPQQGVWVAQWSEHAGPTRSGEVPPAGPDPSESRIPPGLTVRVFDLLFAGSGRALRPVRRVLMHGLSRRRSLGHQRGFVRRLRD
jgi:hypothetical protein